MATLREIRGRIQGVKNIAKITSATKMVAAAKMRKAQDAITAARPYAQKLADILSLLSASLEESVDPLLQRREDIRNIAVIVISADRGLCGSFNSNLLRGTTYHIKRLKERYPKAQIHLITVGKRSCDFFNKRSHNIVQRFPGIFTKLDFLYAQDIAKIAVEGFLMEKFDKVEIMFNEFKSVVKQEVVIHPFLPIEPSPEILEKAKKNSNATTDYIFEPSREQVLSALLPRHLNMQVWRALLESNAAEQAAKMMAMDNATTNAKDLLRNLQLTYNKARQAAITKELLEIVGGAEALRNG